MQTITQTIDQNDHSNFLFLLETERERFLPQNLKLFR
jgi:hypothetical protein